MMRKFYLLFGSVIFLLLIFPPEKSLAQLTVVQGAELHMTPEQLIQTYLVGAGITVSNVTVNGSADTISTNQIGSFSTQHLAQSQLGLSGGILLTSGKAKLAIGPNNLPSAGSQAGLPGDPDLNIISGSVTHDACVLEFDFIPQNDTVRFRYVFGSEEFYEFCSGYNDAFGFFLSGTGINGTFSNNSANIALMPNSTNNYVTINNVCNTVGTNWDNTGGTQFQYDGICNVFTAWHVVTPCSTYHIKLAVADAFDANYDSGVFLEQNSFSSPGVTMTSVNTSQMLGNRALEGCSDIRLYFHLGASLDYPYNVHLSIEGTAVNGVDYTQIPDILTFPPGEDSLSLLIHPVFDTITEGPKTVIVKVNQISCTGVVIADTAIIDDYHPISMNIRPDTTVCHGAVLTYIENVTGGLRPFTYYWNISPFTDSVLTILPDVGQHKVIGRVTDVCPNSWADSAMITVNPKPVADAGANVSIPNGTNINLSGSAGGGFGPYAYSWTSNPPGFISSLQNPNTGNLSFTKIFVLEVSDIPTGCESDPSQTIVTVVGGVLTTNPAIDPSEICIGDPVQLYALAGGGSGLYTYSWTSFPPGFISSDPDPVDIPAQSTQYHLSVNDGFNTTYGTTSVQVDPLPQIHLGPADSTVCVYDTLTLDAGNPGSSYLWSNGKNTRTITVSSSGLTVEIQTYQVVVTNQNFCTDSALINVIFSFDACVGINERSDFRDFSIFPNPAEGSFNILLRPLESLTSLDIYNITGRKVLNTVIEGIPGKAIEKTIDVSDLPGGIYLISINGRGYSGSAKIIIR